MMLKTKKLDIAQLLETQSDVQAFLREAAKDGSASDFIHALGIAARAKGMGEVAKQAGVTRASLYKSLSEDGSPAFETIYKVCHALGVRLTTQRVHGA